MTQTVRQLATRRDVDERARSLVDVLGGFARTLLRAYDQHDVLQQLCDGVAKVLPVTGAGVMVADGNADLRFVAASGARIMAIESLQLELGEGPCLTSFAEGVEVSVEDFAIEGMDRWPRFAPRAVSHGLQSVISYPIVFRGQRLGALNCFHGRRTRFDDWDRRAARAIADVAAAYLSNLRTLDDAEARTVRLQELLDGRVVIEQARGLLATREGTDVDAALDCLRERATASQRSVAEVAREIIEASEA